MEELTEGILERLDSLALSLGTTVEHLWEVLVKQAQVKIIENIIIILLLSALVPICLVLFKKLNKTRVRRKTERIAKKKEGEFTYCNEGDDDVVEIIGMVILGVFVAMSIAIIIGRVSTMPTLILNPEYYALQKVLTLLQ